MPFGELSELLTVREVCHLLNVHPNTLRNWEREGFIDVVRIGKRRDRRYRKKTIWEMMNREIKPLHNDRQA